MNRAVCHCVVCRERACQAAQTCGGCVCVDDPVRRVRQRHRATTQVSTTTSRVRCSTDCSCADPSSATAALWLCWEVAPCGGDRRCACLISTDCACAMRRLDCVCTTRGMTNRLNRRACTLFLLRVVTCWCAQISRERVVSACVVSPHVSRCCAAAAAAADRHCVRAVSCDADAVLKQFCRSALLELRVVATCVPADSAVFVIIDEKQVRTC
jgi:hypothetical protein